VFCLKQNGTETGRKRMSPHLTSYEKVKGCVKTLAQVENKS